MARKNSDMADIEDDVKKMQKTGSSPNLPAPLAGSRSELSESRGLASSDAVARLLGAQGVELEHVGGSLPLIKFASEGQMLVAIYRGRSQAGGEDAEFGLLLFDVLDIERLAESKGKDPQGCVLYRGQVIESTALKDYFAEAESGIVVAITYEGETPTRRGMSNMKLFSIRLVRSKSRK